MRKKFKNIWLYRWKKTPLPYHECKRCGNFNKACPDCNGPTKIFCHDPQQWKCRKCKGTFTILDFEEYDKHTRIEKVDKHL